MGRTLGTTDGLTVRFGRTKPVLVVLGSLSLVVLVTGRGLFDGADWWEMAWAVSLMGLIGFGLLYVLYRVCRRRLALIVNREGIVDNTAPFSDQGVGAHRASPFVVSAPTLFPAHCVSARRAVIIRRRDCRDQRRPPTEPELVELPRLPLLDIIGWAPGAGPIAPSSVRRAAPTP